MINKTIESVYTCLRIELKHLLQHGYIVKGQSVAFKPLRWSNGACIEISSTYTDTDRFIRLRYTRNGKAYDYNIELIVRPSNLEIGEILYLCCPVTGNACRILYSAYDFDIWACRDAYGRPIYYPAQLLSKGDTVTARLLSAERWLNEYSSKRTTIYSGKPTKSTCKAIGYAGKYDTLQQAAFTRLAIAAA